MSNGAHHRRSRHYWLDLSSSACACRTSLAAMLSGGSRWRAGNGFWRTGNSSTTFLATALTALGPAKQAGTVLFGTWVGSGHQFGLRAAANDNSLTASAEARADVELRNAPMVSLSRGPSPTTPNLAPYLWGGSNIDPTAFPSIVLSWNSGAVSGTRGLVNFSLFGNFASPHSDRLRVRTILSILKNGNPFYTDTDDSFVDWAAGDGTFSKTAAGAGDSYTLNIAATRTTRSTASRCACRCSTMASTITSGATRERSRCLTSRSTTSASRCWCLSLRVWLRSARALAGLLGLRRRQEVSGSCPHPQSLSHDRDLNIAPPPQPSPHAGRESRLLPRVRGRLGGGAFRKTNAQALTNCAAKVHNSPLLEVPPASRGEPKGLGSPCSQGEP
jgi:hypothetical protein